MKIPTIINGFNVYKAGNVLAGISDEVKLPDFNTITSTISGAGIAGNIEVPVIGFFEEMEMEIPFRSLVDDTFKVFGPSEQVDVTLRGAIQVTDTATGAIKKIGMRVAVRGYVKAFKPGSVKIADVMNTSITLGITYILIEIDKETKIELDKFNSKFVVDGVDILGDIRSLT